MANFGGALRPNVLVIMADQLRWDWLSVVGTEGVSTPNIDKLAERGIRFTHAVTNAAVCAPARVALATGLSPERTGVLDNKGCLPNDVSTYYQRFRDHGYHVGVIGKLDLAKAARNNGLRGDRPPTYTWNFTHPVEAEGKVHASKAQGVEQPLGPYRAYLGSRGLFGEFLSDYAKRFGTSAETLDEVTFGRSPRYVAGGLDRDSVLPTDAFEDSWIGARAIEWITSAAPEFPWYLFVSFVGPHDPYDPPKEWAERFENVAVPEAISEGPGGKPPNVYPTPWRVGADEASHARRQYSASLALIDDQIGRIFDTLEQHGLTKNTIVAFTADHGEMLGDHGLFQKGVPYEAAIRIPLIVAGPGVRAGVTDAFTELADLHPTLCGLAGVPDLPDVDAESFASLAFGEEIHHRGVVVVSEKHYIAIRDRRFKYVCDIADDDIAMEEAFDLAADSIEHRNLFLSDPVAAVGVRKQLIARAGSEGRHLDRLLRLLTGE